MILQETLLNNMTEVNKQQILKIAELAMLELKNDEIESLEKDLKEILDYVNLLDEVDVSSVKALAHNTNLKNIMRKDEQRKSDSVDLILKQFFDKQERLLKVKEVLNDPQ